MRFRSPLAAVIAHLETLEADLPAPRCDGLACAIRFLINRALVAERAKVPAPEH